jgi:hypothetical protein
MLTTLSHRFSGHTSEATKITQEYVTAAYERVLLLIAVRMKLYMYPVIYKGYMSLYMQDLSLLKFPCWDPDTTANTLTSSYSRAAIPSISRSWA